MRGFTATEVLGGKGTISGGTVVVTDAVEASFDGFLTINETLRFGESGTIVLPSDWKGRYGRWKLFSATNIEGSLRGWVASGILNGKQYVARLVLEDDGVYLAINGPGTEIIIR